MAEHRLHPNDVPGDRRERRLHLGGYFWHIAEWVEPLVRGRSQWDSYSIGHNSFTVRVTDTAAGTTTAAYAITVWPGPPAYSISASPLSQTVTVGSQAQVAFTINPINGFTGSVQLTVGGVGSWSYSPNPATTQSTLTVGPFNATGLFQITAGNNTHVVNLTVNAASSSQPSVTCAASPNPASPGQTVTFTAFGSGGAMPYSYSWSGTQSGSGSTISFQPQANATEVHYSHGP